MCLFIFISFIIRQLKMRLSPLNVMKLYTFEYFTRGYSNKMVILNTKTVMTVSALIPFKLNINLRKGKKKTN